MRRTTFLTLSKSTRLRRGDAVSFVRVHETMIFVGNALRHMHNQLVGALTMHESLITNLHNSCERQLPPSPIIQA